MSLLSRFAAVLALVATPLHAETLIAPGGLVTVEPVITDLEEPWGFGFLPDGGMLITERGARLLHIAPDGTRQAVRGLPEIEVGGQGGLLDVMIPRDFETSRQVFLSLVHPRAGRAGTALAVGRLNNEGSRLDDVEVIFKASPLGNSGVHFGSRVVEAPDGKIFMTIGDRGEPDSAQDLGAHSGSVIRINRDGSVPEDNPFVGQAGALPEIWSYGHRNPQGATLDLDGNLWTVEHGAAGGDELNAIAPGVNYGWPVISYGKNYDSTPIGEGTSKPGMEQPKHYWDPSMAPSGLMIYSGKLWPEWRGHVFVGSLAWDHIAKLMPPRFMENRFEGETTMRVRDVREGPDGAIWFLSVGNGTLYRVTPGR